VTGGIIPAMPPDHADRMLRATVVAAAGGFDCVIVAPGPDLVYLTGYHPPPLERLTAPFLRPGTNPVLLFPELECPRAAAEGAGDVAEGRPLGNQRHQDAADHGGDDGAG